MPSALQYILKFIWPPLALFLLLLLAWQAFVSISGVPKFLLPGPLVVYAAAREIAGSLLLAAGYTLQAALCGFLCSLTLGTLVSFAFAQSSFVRRCGYPYAIFLQTMPIVAIAPLIIAMLGQNVRSVIVVSVIISLFPIITNVTTGLLAVDPKLLEYFRLLRATRWQVLTKLQIPTAVPYALIGAKTSSGLAVVGAIVGEFFAGYGQERYGLGKLIMTSSSDSLRTDKLFAVVIASALLGMLIFAIVNLLSLLLLRRWTAT